jgi:hypothetical protein
MAFLEQAASDQTQPSAPLAADGEAASASSV